MIREISICRCASCGDTPEILSPLRICNYFFGFNGTGKSTIARLIANPRHSDFVDSTVSWTDNHPLDVLVYNRDFIRENFDDAQDLKGVFTLGKETKEAKAEIAEKRHNAATLIGEIGSLKDELTQAEGNLTAFDADMAAACWKAIEPRESVFREVFAGGFLGSQDAFMSELLQHRESNAELHELAWLQERARVVLDASPEPLEPLPDLDTAALRRYEDEPLLKTKIIGSGDVPIGRLVDKMGNSDWLRSGQRFLDASEGKCPFCQQVLPEDLEHQLAAIFNEEFLRLAAAYESFVRAYDLAARETLASCESILDANSEHLDIEAFGTNANAIRSAATVNVERLNAKLKEPSIIVDLVPLADLLSQAESHIKSANARIQDHNRTVADIENQKLLLSGQVWRYFAGVELKPLLNKYAADRQAKTRRIEQLRGLLGEKTGNRSHLESEIEALEAQLTDVRRVLNDINRRLRSFGFRGFSLRATPDGKGYEIVRANGSPARENLSEGERSFVTFLYFYHLIDGSHEASGTTSDKVVVFDDPVSSMDSEVLFIVSTLIRSICDRAADPGSHIQQVFVLTHNVYFHKEVSYKRSKAARDTYWVVRKPDAETCVEGYGASDPIRTSYELLWDEIGTDEPSPATLQNNVRRILEYYFQFLGSTRLKDLPAEFKDDDPDKAICMSMVSWIHDGSHSIADDIVYSSLDPTVVRKYLRVFRRVFEKTGHINHYLMMCSDQMRAEYEADAESAAGAQ